MTSKTNKIIAVVIVVLLSSYIHYEGVYRYFYPPKLFEMPLKTYVINLDRTPKRYEDINNELNKYNIPHERFSAVDGYKIKIENQKTGEIFTGKELQENPEKIDPSSTYLINCPNIQLTYIPKPLPYYSTIQYMTAGEFGVYCSHVEIWKEIVDTKTEYALIFEDDAELKYDFAAKLEQTLRSQPQDWDVIYLFLDIRNSKKITPLPNNDLLLKLQPDDQNTWVMAAMLVSYDGAKKLLDYTKTFNFTIDEELSNAVNENIIFAYITKRYLVTTPVTDFFNRNVKDSTIHKMGRVYK